MNPRDPETPREPASRDLGLWRLPRKGDVRVIENVFVPMPDGERLAAQLWLPADADDRPVPVVLEYIPYRKRDRYRTYGNYWGHTLAQYGLGYARFETRGTGDSSGLLDDEYLPGEQDDACSAIAWLASQPWCDGAVGMRGVSWGGFAALQAAALAPPALKAIMALCASDTRYGCDAHYIGSVFALTGLKWATSFRLVTAGPPDPMLSGENWELMWRERLAASPAIAARWLAHQTNDAYWRQGSVGVDPARIKCPTYLVGGLVDPYCDGLMRLLANLEVPRKALIGPWRHGYPAPASPGPGLDWAFEEVRWWRSWLVGEDTGIMGEPVLRVFMPEATATEVAPGPIPGRWIAEEAWPSPRLAWRDLWLGEGGGLHNAPRASAHVRCTSGQGVGLGKVEWVPFSSAELPHEQSADDARSACFDSAPLDTPLEMLGQARLRVRVAADQPVGVLAIRLCELTADGRSWLVSWGLLNLTRRDGDATASALTPGRFYDVDVGLAFAAHRFRSGSRVRAAISESLWPLVWPSPRPVTLTLETSACRITLPVRPPLAPEPAMPIASSAAHRENPSRQPSLQTSLADGWARVVESWPTSSETLDEIGVTVTSCGPNVRLDMHTADPESCEWRAWQSVGFHRLGWEVILKAEVTVKATETHFQVSESTRASFNGEIAAEIVSDTEIPRRLM